MFDLSIENDQLRAKLQKSNSRIESLEKEIKELKDKKSELEIEDELNEIILEKQGLQIEIDSLRAENAELLHKIQNSHSKEIQEEVLIEWRDKFFKLQQENSAVIKTIEETKLESERLKEEHEIMVHKMETVNEIESQLNAKIAENEELVGNLDELKKQLKEKNYNYEKLTKESKQSHSKISELEKETASLKENLSNALKKADLLEEIKAQNENMRKDNDEVQRYKLQVLEMEKLLANHEKTNLENVEVKQENKRILRQNVAFQERLKASLEQTDMLIKTLTEYRSKMEKITDLECENLELNSTIGKLRQELEEKDQVFESLQKKIQEKLLNLINENKHLKEALREQIELHEVQAEQQQINQKKIQLLTEMNSDSCGALVIEKEGEIESLKKENQTLETICRVSAEQIYQFQNIIETIKSQVTLLSNENSDIRSVCLQMKEELQSKEEENDNLKQKISMLEEINEDQFSDDEVEELKREKKELQSKVDLVELADIISLKSRIQTLTEQLSASKLENRVLNKELAKMSLNLLSKNVTAETPINNIQGNIIKIHTDNEEEEKDDSQTLQQNIVQYDVDDDDAFVDIEVSNPIQRVEKKGLEDIRSEFVRYLEETGQIDDVMKVIKNEDDQNIKKVINEIRKTDLNEIKYLQQQLSENERNRSQAESELAALKDEAGKAKQELEDMKHDSNMYQKHLDDLAHLLK